jgi:ubiquinone/menaquinone biosynthesis C-methylase UbiE
VPEIALNISRGCGNPAGFANLQPGDVVVDFGCGAGIDVILAAHKVGEKGKLIGLDFTPQMIERAKQAVAEAGLKDRDIELRVADIGNSQLPNNFADVVTSNCVINLCTDKEVIYEEAFRILRPGGRIAISDIVFTENIESQLRERFQSTWAGCLGGAIPEEDYLQIVKGVGFNEIQIIARHILTPEELEAMACCPRHILTPEELEAMACCPGEKFTPPPGTEDRLLVEGKVASIKFTAVNIEKA